MEINEIDSKEVQEIAEVMNTYRETLSSYLSSSVYSDGVEDLNENHLHIGVESPVEDSFISHWTLIPTTVPFLAPRGRFNTYRSNRPLHFYPWPSGLN